jgi:hypothetical protein
MHAQHALVALQVWARPVGVGAPDGQHAVAGGAVDHGAGEGLGRVFGVDEDGEFLLLVQQAWHEVSRIGWYIDGGRSHAVLQ